jgi:hypothetical protein
MALTEQDKSEIAALFAAANQQISERLDAFEHEAATRFGRLEETVRELGANGSAVLDAVLGLQVEVAGMVNRVNALTRDITMGRTRDIARVAELERRVEALEEQLRAAKG